jgi:hypothetical protein
MRRTFTTIICTAILAASMTLTASAADAEQNTVTEEVWNETAETAATEGVATDAHSDAALTEDVTEKVVSEDIGAVAMDETKADANGEDVTEKYGADLTEEEMREVILRVAEAVGAYEDDIPAAGKVKEWIMGNLASIVGFFMAISLIIATPIGKKIFSNFITALKSTVTTAKGWKEEVEAVIAKNGEKNAELRASVNEMMSVLKRENEEAIRRAEEAEKNAEQNAKALIEAEAKATEAETRATDVCEAVCRALLVMAKPLETTIQRSKALDELQKDDFYADYKKSVDMINALLEGKNTDGEGEDVAD